LVRGDAKLRADGEADKSEGKIQNAVGGVKGALRNALKMDAPAFAELNCSRAGGRPATMPAVVMSDRARLN
jgi:hypothetical protein